MEASAINQPHGDDPNPDEFFGDGGGAPEGEAAAPAGAPAEPTTQAEREAAGEFEPEPGDPAASGGTAAAPAAAEQPATATTEAPQAEAAPTTETPAPVGDGDGSGDGGGDADDGEAEASSGSKDRPYIVMRELTLTPEVLEKLLKEAKEGVEGAYRKAFFHLDKIETRNAKGALAAAYNKHNENIGNAPRLVATPERFFAPKTVSPKQRTVESLDIS